MNRQRLKNHDWSLTIVAMTLLVIGIIVVYSTTVNASKGSQGEGAFLKQIIFVIFGLLIYFGLSIFDFAWFRAKGILIVLYTTVILSLIYVKLFTQSVSGVNRWIDFGFFSFQPAEYAKLILILLTAAVFTINDKIVNPAISMHSKHKQSKEQRLPVGVQKVWKIILNNPMLKSYLTSILFAVPIFYLVFIQPALGSTLIIIMIWMIMLFTAYTDQKKLLIWASLFVLTIVFILQIFNLQLSETILTVNFNHQLNYPLLIINVILIIAILLFTNLKFLNNLAVIILAASCLMVSVSGWDNLNYYQRLRIQTFIDGPESDPTESGYQVIQSKIAIGSGRLLGRGFLQGTQSNLNILTQAYTDFAFAALAEQFGFVGSSLVLLLYLFLIIRILKIGSESHNSYGAFVCIGIASMIVLHIFINIGMNLGKLPVTGIPLPLVSYGGSSVLIILASLGIVQSVQSSRSSIDISDSLMLRSRSLMH